MGESRRPLIFAALMIQAGFVGVWAAAFPRAFYDHFPGWGQTWVAPTGPYSEHLVRDVGALSLALCVLTAATALRSRWVHQAVGAVAWLVYSVPHLLYHLRGDAHLAPWDRRLSLAVLGVQVVLPLLLLIPQRGPAHARGGPVAADAAGICVGSGEGPR